MILKLYNVTDSPNTINKNIGDALQEIVIHPRQNIDGLLLDVKLSSAVNGANYADIDGTFYIIDSVDTLYNRAIVLHLRKDLLQNYKNELQNMVINSTGSETSNKFISTYADTYDIRPKISKMFFKGGYNFTAEKQTNIITCAGNPNDKGV